MIKGLFGLTIGSVLGGEAIRQVGNVAAIPSGIRSATQSFIGIGLAGKAASLMPKKFFK